MDTLRRCGLQVAFVVVIALLGGCAAGGGARDLAQRHPPDNPAIDMPGFLESAGRAADHRVDRRLSEAAFIRMSDEPGTVVLDARSADKFAELHIAGAINLPFPDITIASLDQLIPDKATHVLIYCNNNFVNAEQPFPTKMATVALNLSTYIALYNHGYRHVYELGPQLDPATTVIALDGTLARGELASAAN